MSEIAEATMTNAANDTTTFLYRHFGEKDDLLYIGVSLSAVQRLSQHHTLSPWFKQIRRVTIESFATRAAALKAETAAIKKEKPLFNIHHNHDDDRYDKTLAEEESEAITSYVLNAVYTIEGAAHLLQILRRHVVQLIESGQLGHFEIPPARNGKHPKVLISGWQLIDYLEVRGAMKGGRR